MTSQKLPTRSKPVPRKHLQPFSYDFANVSIFFFFPLEWLPDCPLRDYLLVMIYFRVWALQKPQIRDSQQLIISKSLCLTQHASWIRCFRERKSRRCHWAVGRSDVSNRRRAHYAADEFDLWNCVSWPGRQHQCGSSSHLGFVNRLEEVDRCQSGKGPWRQQESNRACSRVEGREN